MGAWAYCDVEIKSTLPELKGYPKSLKTIGDHIRARRLRLKLFQHDVAKIIGVCEDSITGWEKNRTTPYIQFMPAIIKFLGYDPVAKDLSTYAGKLERLRSMYGMSQEKLSQLLRVDETSVRSWEKGHRIPSKRMQKKIDSVLMKL